MVDLEDCRDLLAVKKTGELDPFMRLFLSVDGSKRETAAQKTSVHKDTRNPIFNEGYSWEIKPDTDYGRTRVNIQAHDSNGRLRKAEFLGGMSFSIKELLAAPKERVQGWFRLLDIKRATATNLKYVLKTAAGSALANASPSTGAANDAVMQAQAAAKAATLKKSGASGASSASKAGADSSQVGNRLEIRAGSLASNAVVTEEVPQPLSMGINDFDYIQVLGQGSFGKVMLAEHKSTSEVYAIKILGKKEVLEDDDIESTMTERRVLALAGGCKFLTKMYATFQTPERLYYVMEFLNGGDLMYHIQCHGQFTPAQCQFYTAEICVGLGYLHSQGVVYRDLKLDNVMLSADGHIKIADFGMCKEDMNGSARTTTFCGTPGYLAPEILAERPYAKSVDFWSLGVMVYEMMTGESPFDSEDDDQLFDMIQHAPIEYPEHLGESAKLILRGFLTRDENKRLGCTKGGLDEVKRHEYFAGVDWVKLEQGEVEPPFKPDVGKGKEAKNFDDEFTNCSASLEEIDPNIVAQFNQEEFEGFSFVNPDTFAELMGASKTDRALIAAVEAARSKWYRATAKRRVIADLLKDTARGTFYIRDSTSHANSYALTVWVGASKPWNGLISTLVQPDGTIKYRLFQETRFDSIAHLIQFYREHPIMRTAKDEPIMLIIPEK